MCEECQTIRVERSLDKVWVISEQLTVEQVVVLLFILLHQYCYASAQTVAMVVHLSVLFLCKDLRFHSFLIILSSLCVYTKLV